MKKAVIQTGGKQYLVAEGETIDIELLHAKEKTVDFTPLAVIDGDKVQIGAPEVSGAKVTAAITEQSIKDDKVIAIRYKAKKRVKKVRGHRQQKTQISITKIT